MIIESDIKLDFSDVLIRPKRSMLTSRSEVDLVRTFVTLHGEKMTGVPLIAANMATGTFRMLDVFAKNQMFVAIAKHHSNEWDESFNNVKDILNSSDEKNKRKVDVFKKRLMYGFYTIGMRSEKELQTLKNFSDKVEATNLGRVKVCVDIANGYTQKYASYITELRKMFPTNVIIAGNVCTPEMVSELIIAGADFIKIGIGPGSQCETRKVTGVGIPQISAAISCADAAHNLSAGIVLDGGMQYPGDVCKAFCANTDMVMLGGLFAGTDESDGEIITKHFVTDEIQWLNDKEYSRMVIEKKYKLFYGMSSDYALERHFGGKKNYRASEGKVEEVEYIGAVQLAINEILGGLRSCGTYIGAAKIKHFGKCGSFIRCTKQHNRF